MEIYDCFTFNDELDLLEIRLEELYDHVDHFVLVESRQTHARFPKKLYYQENKERYKKYSKKIIHIIMDMPPLNFIDKLIIKRQLDKPIEFLSNISLSYGLGRMKMDWAQRSAIKLGLKNAKDEDIIIISDLDEIPRVEKLEEAINLAKEGKLVGFQQKIYVYYLNGEGETNSLSSKMCSFRTLRKKLKGDPQNLRIPPVFTRLKNKILGKKAYHNNVWFADLEVIENGGWHFSFLGGAETIKSKIKNYPHIENFSIKKDTVLEKIEKDIEEGIHRGEKVKYVKIDDYFTRSIKYIIIHILK